MIRHQFLITSAIILSVICPAFGLSNTLRGFFTNFPNVIASLVGAGKFLSQSLEYMTHEVQDGTPKNGEEFDFIIVGAGSAGATITSRLSEISDLKILLIEAGAHEFLLMDIPIMALYLQTQSKIDWIYRIEKSKNYCLGMENRQCRLASGKVLGGSSSLNFMIATRGNKHDYNEWAQLTGDQNWSYDGMMQTFRKMETYHNNWVKYDYNYHGFGGPLRITNPPYRTSIVEAFVEAGKEFGFTTGDYNGPTQTGFHFMQTNQRHGERLSSNRAYLHPAAKRKNLVVSINSHVNRILIDPHTRVAYGVEFTKNGKNIKVLARKEVILSAGAIASPKLLMLSGIGPRDHLESLGINVLQDLPVGKNLMDHIGYGGLVFMVNDTVGLVPSELMNPSNDAFSQYINHRIGPLTTAGSVEGLGFVNVDNYKEKNDSPNIELMFSSSSFVSDDSTRVPFAITGKFSDYFDGYMNHHSYAIWPILMKPQSRGRIMLRSRNPADKPRIIANYFSNPEDLRILVKGVRMAIEVSKSKAMQRYGSRLMDRVVPGCEMHEPDSDSYWECAVRTYTITLWHLSGTCKMGHEYDPTSVVNSNLQVRGIKNLRVADASIMPVIITGHTNIPAIAIGEKFSDLLKLEYGYY